MADSDDLETLTTVIRVAISGASTFVFGVSYYLSTFLGIMEPRIIDQKPAAIEQLQSLNPAGQYFVSSDWHETVLGPKYCWKEEFRRKDRDVYFLTGSNTP